MAAKGPSAARGCSIKKRNELSPLKFMLKFAASGGRRLHRVKVTRAHRTARFGFAPHARVDGIGDELQEDIELEVDATLLAQPRELQHTRLELLQRVTRGDHQA